MKAEFLGIRRDLVDNSRFSHQRNQTLVGVTRGLNFTLNQCAAGTGGHARHNKRNMRQHADTLSLYIYTLRTKQTHILHEAKVYFVTFSDRRKLTKQYQRLMKYMLCSPCQNNTFPLSAQQISLHLNLVIFAAVFSPLANYGNPNRRKT